MIEVNIARMDPSIDVPLESILCTDELNRRPSRLPDYLTENRALVSLAQALADSPRTILHTLTDIMLETLHCGSAGISLLSTDGTQFHWPAIAGLWKPHIGRGSARDFGPCGDVLDRNVPLLFRHLERRYVSFQSITPPIEEYLSVPLYIASKAVGTIWAITHDKRRSFDNEDLRMLVSLGGFASSACRAAESWNELDHQGEERYRTLFDLAPIAVYSCDASGVIRDYNNRAAELWGRKPAPGDTDERFCGSFRLYRPDGTFIPHEQCPMGDVLSGRVPGTHDAEVVIERPDASRVIVIVNIAPLTNDRGEITGAINCFYDVTARKALEREYETLLTKEHASRMEAEAANRSKDVFLAMLSHEVRTPLSAMLGWATILRKKQCTQAEMQEGIKVIERNCRAQAQLMDDALEVSRIISGKLRLDIKPCDLASVIYAAIDVVRVAADAKSIELSADINPDVISFSCDNLRMQQVVWNLLTNAIKFTPKGGHVRVLLDREDSHARIVVTDDGQGIDRELLPYVFDRFRQADGSTRRHLGGLGLGLSIVKHLVELHGGTVKAHSDGDGNGATFTIHLPIPAIRMSSASGDGSADGAERRDRAVVRLDGLRILVVDDEADCLRLVGKVLAEVGASVMTAGSVQEAMAALEIEPPDILVSDLGIPDEDGFDLIRQIRDAGYTAQQLPAVALTAFANKDHANRALLCGFQIHIRKPVDADDLITIVADLAGRTP
ncbi:MAG TPA: ATP-binding protein [Steroidobacteraceae bacterium]|jgi:signal transduction histidine kinase/CheY-like chemotaxis protein